MNYLIITLQQIKICVISTRLFIISLDNEHNYIIM